MPVPLPLALALAQASLGDDLAVLDDPLAQRRFSRYSADAAGERIADSSLRISGMHCAACAGLIEQALCGVDGVLGATVSAAGERARVRWRPQRTRAAALVAAIRAAGYDATPDAALGACRTWGVDSEKRPQRGQFLPDLQAHSPAMGQKAVEKWTAEAVSQPTFPKPDSLLAQVCQIPTQFG